MARPGVREMNDDDTMLIKKIVDREWIPGERIDFFARAEMNPELWRELALGLWEDRTIADLLRPDPGEMEKMGVAPSKSPKKQMWRVYMKAGIFPALMGIAAGWLVGVVWPWKAVPNAKPSLAESPWYLGTPRLAGYPATRNLQAVDEAIVPVQARERLKRLGVDVQESTVIYLLENESGDHVAFPARQAAFRFPEDQ